VIRRFLRHRSAVLGAVLIALFVIAAALGERLTPYGFDQLDLSSAKQPPSLAHWLGTDALGRDLLTRVIVGARISLVTSVTAVFGALAVGTVLGILAAFGSRTIDNVVMRFMDLLLALPGLLLAIFAVSILGFGLAQLTAAIAIYSIPTFARLARSSAMAVRQREYIQAAAALGVSQWRVLLKHVLPNITSPLLTLASLRLATANLSIASLGFLGLGAQPPTPEWGLMIASGRTHLISSPHIPLAPGIALLIVVLGFNLLGDGLRDITDPKSRR
jgi:peptide/nickel transport system permease protein